MIGIECPAECIMKKTTGRCPHWQDVPPRCTFWDGQAVATNNIVKDEDVVMHKCLLAYMAQCKNPKVAFSEQTVYGNCYINVASLDTGFLDLVKSHVNDLLLGQQGLEVHNVIVLSVTQLD